MGQAAAGLKMFCKVPVLQQTTLTPHPHTKLFLTSLSPSCNYMRICSILKCEKWLLTACMSKV